MREQAVLSADSMPLFLFRLGEFEIVCTYLLQKGA